MRDLKSNPYHVTNRNEIEKKDKNHGCTINAFNYVLTGFYCSNLDQSLNIYVFGMLYKIL